jgi:signal transduction histidine kinase
MIKTKLFQKYLLVGSSLVLLFVFLGIYFSNYLTTYMRPTRQSIPPIFFAKLVDQLGGDDKLIGLQKLQDIHREGFIPNLVLLDTNGLPLSTTDEELRFNWETLQKPTQAYDYTELSSVSPSHRPPPGPPGFLGLFRGPRPPEFNHKDFLIRLSGPQELYLLILPGPPPQRKRGLPPEGPRRWVPWIGVASLIISLIVGVGVTISLVYYSVRNGVDQVDHVIDELHKGNLKARFNVNRSDEFGKMMKRFNFMADEIESLVTNLRDSEEARRKLLQELAHDLRTPIASLKSLLETLDQKEDQLEKKVKKELVELSFKEVSYFERLVEDLLFLAQVDDPSYGANMNKVDITEILESEATTLQRRFHIEKPNLQLDLNLPDHPISVQGDRHVLRRLFRNALENAFSFATGNITVSLVTIEPSQIVVKISDDGPGVSDEILNNFGKKRITRQMNDTSKGRISIGLGGVVMNKICQTYRGSLQIQNRRNLPENKQGTLLQIVLSSSPGPKTAG